MIPISSIQTNPNNPRKITAAQVEKLKKSISEFSAMMELRPIIIDEQRIVLGGNMRLLSLIQLGYTEIPESWVKQAADLTDEEKQRFIIADNVGFGEWDWEVLANEWDAGDLTDWGLDVPDFAVMPELDDLIADEKNKPPTMKITFPTPEDLQKCETELQEVLNRLCPNAFYSVSAGEI